MIKNLKNNYKKELTFDKLTVEKQKKKTIYQDV
jgi:hypothetical protein